ncbi:MAG: ParB N-terminal domain-containing protein [Cypionkella sp.]
MAKRKRLTPAQPDHVSTPLAMEAKTYLRPGIAPPPIAQVAGDASTTAALVEVSAALASARAEGRLLQLLPLTAIDADYLVRDRIGADPEEMQSLMDSLRSHGQRSPIEVTEIASGRYGLISGWRRITALARLQEQTGDTSFGSVLALLRHPDTAGDAYIAMVEENEIRLGLSYFERARIAAKAVEQGVFATDREALQKLFATASRAKRSKIGSFLSIYRNIGHALRFPSAMPERLGLMLSKRLSDHPDYGISVVQALQANPAKTAGDELILLSLLIKNKARNAPEEPILRPARKGSPKTKDFPELAREVCPGVFLQITGDAAKPTLILFGSSIDSVFRERLEEWLQHS